MAILDIVKFPHAALLKTTKPIDTVTDQTRRFNDNMFETMYHDNGCGLAANQVNVNQSIFVMDFSEDKSGQYVFINPEIIEEKGSVTDSEGCLSFPGVYVKITRPAYIKVKALDYNGNEIIHEFEGYDARCVHHEYDHLRGVTFFDHLKPMQRKMAEKKLVKRKKTKL